MGNDDDDLGQRRPNMIRVMEDDLGMWVMGVLVVCLGMLLGVVVDVLGMRVMELVVVCLGLLVGVVDDGLGVYVIGVLLEGAGEGLRQEE